MLYYAHVLSDMQFAFIFHDEIEGTRDMSQYPPNPNVNPYGQNQPDPQYNPGTSYGGPPSGPPSGQPGQEPNSNPYNPYPNPTNPPSGPGTNPNPYGPYGVQNPATPAPPPYDPYSQTVLSQKQNYNPYTVVPPAPTLPQVPPRQPRKGPSMRVVIIAVIALVLIIGGVAFGLISNNNTQQGYANATATAQANGKATATAHANASATSIAATATASAIANTYPFSANLKMSDPLSDNSKGFGWQTDNFCKFQGNAYHVFDNQANTFGSCSAVNTDLNDFTFEVEAVLNKGDAIGVTYRGNANKSQFYRLAVYTDGSYAIYVYVDTTGTNSRKLTSGSITPTPNLSNTNTLSIVARGSSMAFYFNHTLITTVSDPT